MGAGLLAQALWAARHVAPRLLLLLIAAEVVVSPFKVRLPLTKGRATMSLTYAVDFVSLLLLGPAATLVGAMAGVWTQCTFRSISGLRTPAYQTVFSMAAVAVSVAATGAVYAASEAARCPRPQNSSTGFVAAVCIYFFVNTALVAGAIGLGSRQSVTFVWRDSFLWAAPSYFVSGAVAVAVAGAFVSGPVWPVPVAGVPLLLSFWAYKRYLGRYEVEQARAIRAGGPSREGGYQSRPAPRSEECWRGRRRCWSGRSATIRDGVVTTDRLAIIQYMNPGAELMSSRGHGCHRARHHGRVPVRRLQHRPRSRSQVDHDADDN